MKIRVKLFEKIYDGERTIIPISDLPSELLVPENNIEIHVIQGYFDNNGWHEGETHVEITHVRERTKEEKEELRLHFEKLKTQRKKERYEQYLELKKEFENEIQTNQ